MWYFSFNVERGGNSFRGEIAIPLMSVWLGALILYTVYRSLYKAPLVALYYLGGNPWAFEQGVMASSAIERILTIVRAAIGTNDRELDWGPAHTRWFNLR